MFIDSILIFRVGYFFCSRVSNAGRKYHGCNWFCTQYFFLLLISICWFEIGLAELVVLHGHCDIHRIRYGRASDIVCKYNTYPIKASTRSKKVMLSRTNVCHSISVLNGERGWRREAIVFDIYPNNKQKPFLHRIEIGEIRIFMFYSHKRAQKYFYCYQISGIRRTISERSAMCDPLSAASGWYACTVYRWSCCDLIYFHFWLLSFVDWKMA